MKLHKFEIGHIDRNKNLLILGQDTANISELILDYLDYNLDLPVGTVCITENETIYDGKIPPVFIYRQATNDLFNKFTNRQVKISKKVLDQTKVRRKRILDPRTFLILDRTLVHPYQISLNNILSNSSYLNATTIIGVDNPSIVSDEMMIHIDYVFVSKFNDENNIKIIHKLLGIDNLSYNIFLDIINQITSQNLCLVIDVKKKCTSIENTLYWYKYDIERLQHFRICNPEYWVISNKMNS